jgi:hypothetical protein
VTRRHRRFALKDVTFAGASLPGVTMDCWEDDGGQERWTARAVARADVAASEGDLAGTTREGRLVTGHVVVVESTVGPNSRMERIIEFHGSGELRGLTDPPG